MKKQITPLRFCTLLLILFLCTQASAQNDKDKGKKEHKKESHSKGKDKHDINKDKDDPVHGKENKGNNTNDKNAKNKKDNPKSKDWSKTDGSDIYKWNRETFNDRHKIKNKEKVTVCHKFKGDDEPGVSLKVSSHALQAHLNHGDVRGECSVSTARRYSDNFLARRTNYYTTVENTQEQVSYSQSVLVYALERLSNSRQQLAVMQSNNTPVAVIEQKKATVVELEQNVSLLETLIGVAVNLVANKLQ